MSTRSRRRWILLAVAAVGALASGVAAFLAWRARQPFWLELPATRLITSVAFDPSGRWLVAADYDGSLAVWSLADRTLERTAPSPVFRKEPIGALAFTPEGLLAVATFSRVRLRRLPGLEVVRELDTENASGNNTRLAIAGNLLANIATVGTDATSTTELHVWDTAPEPRLLASDVVARRSSIQNRPRGLRSPNWIAPLGDVETRLVAFDHEGERVITASYFGKLAIREARTGKVVRSVETEESVRCGAASPVDELVALGVTDKAEGPPLIPTQDGLGVELRRFDGSLRAKLEAAEPTAGERQAGERFASSIGFSPDGRGLAALFAHVERGVVFGRSMTQTGWMELWDVDLQRRMGTIDFGTHPPEAVAFSPDGNRLAVAVDDRVLVFNPTEPAKAQALATRLR